LLTTVTLGGRAAQSPKPPAARSNYSRVSTGDPPVIHSQVPRFAPAALGLADVVDDAGEQPRQTMRGRDDARRQQRPVPAHAVQAEPTSGSAAPSTMTAT